MLHHLDDSLEAYLRDLVPLPPRDVDVSFDTPDREWGSGITRPTLNLFLWDVRRSQRRATAGMETVDVGGRPEHRRPAPRVEFRYLVTAWASENRDQHQILGAVLRTVVARPEIPDAQLRGELIGLDPRPRVELATVMGNTQSELWTALDGQLKAGLDLMITLPIETGVGLEAGPPVDQVELVTRDQEGHRPSGRRSMISEGPSRARG